MKKHRLIAEKVLGRPLLAGEVVHHIDGDKANNAPANLLVLPSAGRHASLHAYLRRSRLGQPTLFPELLEGEQREREGTLFEHILL